MSKLTTNLLLVGHVPTQCPMIAGCQTVTPPIENGQGSEWWEKMLLGMSWKLLSISKTEMVPGILCFIN